jgi:sigma-B regulation protein RsbU (phosphoserine phosphatase)
VKLLIADDDTLFRMMLRQMLCEEYELEIVENGDNALAALQREDSPQLAILDWVMPGLSGPQVCREVRTLARAQRPYLLLVTSKNNRAEEIAGLEAGADDYVVKPFQPEELHARLKVGRRVIELQNALEEQVAATRSALETNRLLRKVVPPCSYCQAAEECLLIAPSMADFSANGQGRAFCPQWIPEGDDSAILPQLILGDTRV